MKRVFSVFLSLMVILSTSGVFAFSQESSEVTVITTAQQLSDIRNALDGNYVLGADIIFEDSMYGSTGEFYNNGEGFIPIGTSSSAAFTGTFDGNGYMIKNLYINRPTKSYTGLFGYNKGQISNLALVDADVKGLNYVGAIAGDNTAGTIKQSYVSDSNVFANSSGKAYTGIIAGFNRSASVIENCYTNSDINSKTGYYCAGIAGYNDGKIRTSYSDSMSQSKYYCAIAFGGRGTEANCYFYDRIFKGSDDNSLIVVSQYAKSAEELSDETTFVNYDFTDVWTIDKDGEYKYPQFRTVAHRFSDEKQNANTSFASGNGTSYNPFIIKTAEDFSKIADYPNCSYTLSANIDLTKSSFTAIPSFYGKLAGNGYTVTANEKLFSELMGRVENLEINTNIQGATENGSAIAGANYGTVISCKTKGTINGEASAIGGISAVNNGIITLCENHAEINSSGDAGGISAVNNAGISKTVNYGKISGDKAAGIAASGMQKGVITECSNTAAVTGVTVAGGIAGTWSAGSTISRCANTGYICSTGEDGVSAGIVSVMNTSSVVYAVNAGTVKAGGDKSVAGGIAASNYSYVQNCYNTANIYSGNTAGGIAGINNSNEAKAGTVRYCHNTGFVSGNSTVAGAIVGENFAFNAAKSPVVNSCYYLDNNEKAIGSGSELNVAVVNSITKDKYGVLSNFAGFESTIWNVDGGIMPELSYLPNSAVSNMRFEVDSLEMQLGEVCNIPAVLFEPQNVYIASITYSADKADVVSVLSDGTIKALSEGTAVITAVNLDGSKADLTVTVKDSKSYSLWQAEKMQVVHSSYGVFQNTAPITYVNGKLYAPLRSGLEAADCTEILFDSDTGEISFNTKDGKAVEAKMDSRDIIVIDGAGKEQSFTIGSAPLYHNGKAYIPVRDLGAITGRYSYYQETSGYVLYYMDETADIAKIIDSNKAFIKE